MVLSDEQKTVISIIVNGFLDSGPNRICALDMGLGKTLVACEVINKLLYQNPERKILIIHKASNFLDPWHNELKRNIQSKYIPMIYLHGKDRIKHLTDEAGKYSFGNRGIIQTTYDTAMLDIARGRFASEEFSIIIFDELQTIINHKKLTLKIRALASLRAKHTLALSGAPIQNDPNELELMFLFLNEPEKILNFSGRKMPKEILASATDSCAEKKALIRIEGRNENIEKNAVTLLIPANREMLEFIREQKKITEKQKVMYLSIPQSIYFANNIPPNLPPCTKVEAVKIILKAMEQSEKAVIFSQYIDVISAYYNVCRESGFPALVITGKDKGKEYEEKLALFRNSWHFRVLLTTLQKSSEGLNLGIATHIIILELWWNPQKIIQAMSRVDRKTQKRNIFVFLLCYSEDGEIIAEEKNVSAIMKNKFKAAQEKYRETNKNDERMERFGILKELPPEIKFTSYDTFARDLTGYISKFKHSVIPVPKIALPDNKYSIVDARKYASTKLSNIGQFFANLASHPWLFSLPEYYMNFNAIYEERISGLLGNELWEQLNKAPFGRAAMKKADEYHPFLFVKQFTADQAGRTIFPELYYLIGKRQDGGFDLLYLGDKYEHFVDDLAERLISYKDKRTRLVVSPHYFADNFSKKLQSRLNKKCPNVTIHICFTALFDYIVYSFSRMGINLQRQTILELRFIFSQNTVRDACDSCRNILLPVKKSSPVIQDIQRWLKRSHELYRYRPEQRRVAGTTNIIDYIDIIAKLLIQGEEILDPLIALSRLQSIVLLILNNGEKIFPFWHKLIKRI